jgi:hypothetical protein
MNPSSTGVFRVSQTNLLADSATLDRAIVAARRRTLFPTLVTLLDRLSHEAALQAEVIAWGCPVPAFGDLAGARVATLGLNPSNREFMDEYGGELAGDERRFHTLASLGLSSWEDADADDIEQILVSCREYFTGKPYDRWFRRLDAVISATGASYYNPESPACHLDLVPYATGRKWGALTPRQRDGLIQLAGDTLGLLLRRSAIRVLILNGESVVSYFQHATGISLERAEMSEWALPRQAGAGVKGYRYLGRVDSMSGFPLPQELLVLGFNHNLQSSYGVTTHVIESIRCWIGTVSQEALRSRAAVRT